MELRELNVFLSQNASTYRYSFTFTTTRKWRTLVPRYARDNCVLTLMVTRNYVYPALYVHRARLHLTTVLYI